MGSIKNIEQKIIGLPEWCLDAFINAPAVEEVEATVKHLLENPDIAAAPTVIEDAVFSLVVRTKDGARLFADKEIAMLAKRQRDVIDRVITECSKLTGELSTIFIKAIRSTQNAVTK